MLLTGLLQEHALCQFISSHVLGRNLVLGHNVCLRCLPRRHGTLMSVHQTWFYRSFRVNSLRQTNRFDC